MPDEMDYCQQASQTHLDDAIARRIAARPSHNSLPQCEECDEEIPPARQQAVPGCTRCVGCQQDHEQRLKLEGATR